MYRTYADVRVYKVGSDWTMRQPPMKLRLWNPKMGVANESKKFELEYFGGMNKEAKVASRVSNLRIAKL